MRSTLTPRQELVRDFLLKFCDNSGKEETKIMCARRMADAVLQSDPTEQDGKKESKKRIFVNDAAAF